MESLTAFNPAKWITEVILYFENIFDSSFVFRISPSTKIISFLTIFLRAEKIALSLLVRLSNKTIL